MEVLTPKWYRTRNRAFATELQANTEILQEAANILKESHYEECRKKGVFPHQTPLGQDIPHQIRYVGSENYFHTDVSIIIPEINIARNQKTVESIFLRNLVQISHAQYQGNGQITVPYFFIPFSNGKGLSGYLIHDYTHGGAKKLETVETNDLTELKTVFDLNDTKTVEALHTKVKKFSDKLIGAKTAFTDAHPHIKLMEDPEELLQTYKRARNDSITITAPKNTRSYFFM